jgi:hypothetical protein
MLHDVSLCNHYDIFQCVLFIVNAPQSAVIIINQAYAYHLISANHAPAARTVAFDLLVSKGTIQ